MRITHSIQYNGCRYKGQEFPVLKISAKIRVKVGNPVLNQSGIRVKEWDSVMIFAKNTHIEIIQVVCFDIITLPRVKYTLFDTIFGE